MPKEYINSMDHGRSVPIRDLDADEDAPVKLHKMDDDALIVSWSKDYQGVALKVVDREKDPDGLGSIIDQPEVRTINLDRNGVNRLVRFLRRARDDAFGKDE